MVKRLLLKVLVTDRIKVDPARMTETTLVLYIIAFWVMSLSGDALVAEALFCFIRIATWMCIAWLWADILWLNKHSWLRDRRIQL